MSKPFRTDVPTVQYYVLIRCLFQCLWLFSYVILLGGHCYQFTYNKYVNTQDPSKTFLYSGRIKHNSQNFSNINVSVSCPSVCSSYNNISPQICQDTSMCFETNVSFSQTAAPQTVVIILQACDRLITARHAMQFSGNWSNMHSRVPELIVCHNTITRWDSW